MKLIILPFLLTLSMATMALDHTHTAWDQLLKDHVIKDAQQTWFQYKKLKDSGENMSKLNSYLDELSKVTKKEFLKFSKAQRLAFLINAYNGFTVKLIIDKYPVKSIKDIGGLFTNTWKIKFFTLLEEKTYLDHIEHGLIRKMFKEPRIHFAVNCASIGCPNLQAYAFTGKDIKKQLDKAEKDFFADTEKNKIHHGKKKMKISKIFSWFKEDFVKKHGSLEKYLAQAMPLTEAQKKDLLEDKYDIDHASYDWNLNGK